MNSGKIVLGVLAGIAAGAVLGILFAPDKGSNTRKNICKRSEDFKEDINESFTDGLNDKYNDFAEIIYQKMEAMKDRATDFSKANDYKSQ